MIYDDIFFKMLTPPSTQYGFPWTFGMTKTDCFIPSSVN